MSPTIPTIPDSVNPESDLIKDDISIIAFRRSSTGNQLFLKRAGSGAYRNFAAMIAPDDVAINYGTFIVSMGAWIDSNIDTEHLPWEVPDVKTMVLGAPSFAHFEQAHRIINTGSIDVPNVLTVALDVTNTGRSATPTFYAWLEDRIQTKVENETKEITEYYEEQLAIKESEIGALSNELSQIKKVSQQHNYESEQIANQYKEEITKIPEVQQIVYTQYEKSIEFIIVVNSIERDLFYHLSQIESQLCDQYTDWIFEFETIGSRTFSQQPRDGYVNLFSRD